MFVRGVLLQFGLYLVVGGLSFLGDLGSFVLLMSGGMTVLWASAASFVVGCVINYFLSTRLAFRGGRFGRSMEVGSFLAVALIGLGLTTTLMYMLTGWARLTGVVAKVITVPIVLMWNFLGRRFFVFHSDMPTEMAALSARLFAHLERN
jgi:putative flippase GtrA